MRDPVVWAVLVVLMFVWLVVLTAHALRMADLLKAVARQGWVHAGVLSGIKEVSAEEKMAAEAEAVREWQDGLRSEKRGSPRWQAYAARLRSRGIPVDD